MNCTTAQTIFIPDDIQLWRFKDMSRCLLAIENTLHKFHFSPMSLQGSYPKTLFCEHTTISVAGCRRNITWKHIPNGNII